MGQSPAQNILQPPPTFETPTEQTGERAPQRFPGLRGRALKRRRQAAGIGQAHLARALELDGPRLSVIENEGYRRLPRGLGSQYQAALQEIMRGHSPHFTKCGCEAVR